MVRKKNQVEKIIKSYLNLLSKEIKIEKVILFGSFANGTYDNNSDIDLAIISTDFQKKDYITNMRFLLSKTINFDWPPIEALPYTPKEYNTCDSRTFLAEIKRTGKFISWH